MANDVPDRYKPRYAGSLDQVDASMQSFLTGFYCLSDDITKNEQWVNSFTDKAHVDIGGDSGVGTEGIRELRGRMWAVVQERRHTVLKVFLGQFENPAEPECMIQGKLKVSTKDGRLLEASWSGHAVLRRVDGEWKLAQYRVWVQTQ
ncbi:hypothetical protein BGZ63DRAFT_400012 [Mariannaea sp. PMI_226]|nr:hypothetical protein BGZ63DRAFT_400012 [Mariannaea sp. PMI_226]